MKNRISRPRRLPTMQGIVRLPFRDVTTIPRTATAGFEISEIDLAISAFSSTSAVRVMAALYENFRVRDLRIHAYYDSAGVFSGFSGPVYTFAGFSHALGFIPESNALYSTASSYQDVLQLPSAQMGAGSKPLSLRIGSRELAHNSLKWYNTASTGTPPTGSLSPGSITYATHTLVAQTSNASRSYVVITGVVEFCNPISSGLASLQHSVHREEEKLRIDTIGEHFDYDHPRTSDRLNSAYAGSSVPNTPTSVSSSNSNLRVALALSEGRSDRQLDRTRLVRQ